MLCSDGGGFLPFLCVGVVLRVTGLACTASLSSDSKRSGGDSGGGKLEGYRCLSSDSFFIVALPSCDAIAEASSFFKVRAVRAVRAILAILAIRAVRAVWASAFPHHC